MTQKRYFTWTFISPDMDIEAKQIAAQLVARTAADRMKLTEPTGIDWETRPANYESPPVPVMSLTPHMLLTTFDAEPVE